MLSIQTAPAGAALRELTAAPQPTLPNRAWSFISADVPHWLGNLGAAFPTAALRGVVQTGTAYAGFYASHQMQDCIHDMGDKDAFPALLVAGAATLVGGGMIGVQVASLLKSGWPARAADPGEPRPVCLDALRAAVLSAMVLGPLATAFVVTELTDDRRRGLEVLNTVAGLYVYSAVRDFINELLPRHLLLELADYDGAMRLDAASAVRLRGSTIMAASVLPNSVAAFAGRRVLQPLLVDVVLAQAITRGLYAFVNEMSRGVAASLEGEGATVRPVPAACRPHPSVSGWAEESAMRSALALPAQGLYGLGGLVGDDTLINVLAQLLVTSVGCTASAVSEFRGLLLQLGRLGQLLEAMPVEDAPTADAALVRIHVAPVDLQQPVSFHVAPVERARQPYIYL
ncbi:hypothetical protein BH11PSE7_BH11PSE7_13860 [soil metagenome]